MEPPIVEVLGAFAVQLAVAGDHGLGFFAGFGGYHGAVEVSGHFLFALPCKRDQPAGCPVDGKPLFRPVVDVRHDVLL